MMDDRTLRSGEWPVVPGEAWFHLFDSMLSFNKNFIFKGGLRGILTFFCVFFLSAISIMLITAYITLFYILYIVNTFPPDISPLVPVLWIRIFLRIRVQDPFKIYGSSQINEKWLCLKVKNFSYLSTIFSKKNKFRSDLVPM